MADPDLSGRPGTTGQDANAVYALGAKIVAPALAEMITNCGWPPVQRRAAPAAADQIATLEHGEPLS